MEETYWAIVCIFLPDQIVSLNVTGRGQSKSKYIRIIPFLSVPATGHDPSV